ncbi:unnamed protein product [Euphydryas editha]|uniref:Nucleic-acid-binding protein from transposon X-element n=1 Tax=Euphydryas editha TaxID=104508 RepID=A0AAU9VBL7_EUPED|nr:unnamed protein product [Euphydryas editha]
MSSVASPKKLKNSSSPIKKQKKTIALQELGFPAERARCIPPSKGRHGCTYFVQLAHLQAEELTQLYAVTELLSMPGLIVEAWRGNKAPSQCHRCQAFGHSSANCHRQQKCVRCFGEHLARDCHRPREELPTCANCGKAHTAKVRRCPVFKKEARKRGISLAPPRPTASDGRVKGVGKRPPPPPLTQEEEVTDDRPQPLPKPAPRTTGVGTASKPANGQEMGQIPELTAPVTTLAPPANLPSSRRQPSGAAGARNVNEPDKKKKKKRTKRAARPARSDPAAASTPQPRRSATAAVPECAPPPGQEAETMPASNTGPTNRPSGPDTLTIIRVFMEALSAMLLAYTQGQDIVPAISVGMAALSQLHSS